MWRARRAGTGEGGHAGGKNKDKYWKMNISKRRMKMHWTVS